MWRYLLAFTLFQVAFSATLNFELSEDNDVAIQTIDVFSTGYNGVVQSTITPSTSHDLLLCINWLVPAEAPEVNLSAVWPLACAYTLSIPRQKNPQPVDFSSQLRSGANYVSLTANDMDSVGHLPISLDYTIGTCDAGSYGPDCTNVTTIQLDQTVSVVNGNSSQYLLSTLVDTTSFVQNLNIAATGNLTGASIYYRLSGPVLPGVTDGSCTDLTKSCQIVTPPMTNSKSFWIITVTGTLNFTVHANTCKSNSGSSCKTTLNDGTKLKNSVTQASGAMYYTFPAPAFDVAVGGLDGYEQTLEAPDITVQIDNVPGTIVLSSGIKAQSNRLTINMTGSPLINENSTFIVFVNAKGSFGIWIPNDNSTCANNCSGVGECVDYTCACPTGGKPEYNGLGCEHEVKSFTIEYVILIAVGGLLVLSIVIGVPVYCWMNRHPEYETVA